MIIIQGAFCFSKVQGHHYLDTIITHPQPGRSISCGEETKPDSSSAAEGEGWPHCL